MKLKYIFLALVVWMVSLYGIDYYYNKQLTEFYKFVTEVVLPGYCK